MLELWLCLSTKLYTLSDGDYDGNKAAEKEWTPGSWNAWQTGKPWHSPKTSSLVGHSWKDHLSTDFWQGSFENMLSNVCNWTSCRMCVCQELRQTRYIPNKGFMALDGSEIDETCFVVDVTWGTDEVEENLELHFDQGLFLLSYRKHLERKSIQFWDVTMRSSVRLTFFKMPEMSFVEQEVLEVSTSGIVIKQRRGQNANGNTKGGGT